MTGAGVRVIVLWHSFALATISACAVLTHGFFWRAWDVALVALFASKLTQDFCGRARA